MEKEEKNVTIEEVTDILVELSEIKIGEKKLSEVIGENEYSE